MKSQIRQPMKVISINQLFEKLNESQLKQVNVYFDGWLKDKFDVKKIDVEVLCIALIHKDGTTVMKSYYDLHQLFPGGNLYIKIPCNSFKDRPLTKKLMNAVIDADRVSFNHGTLFYHKCNVIESPVQSKLNALVNERSNDKLRAVDELARKCNIDDIDDTECPDGLFD